VVYQELSYGFFTVPASLVLLVVALVQETSSVYSKVMMPSNFQKRDRAFCIVLIPGSPIFVILLEEINSIYS
jgi:hypothetical protein